LLPNFIEVFGRKIPFAKTYKKILVTNFDELFAQELGYIDYVNICQNFTIIIVEDMPIISSDNNDLATRFINFIDNAYFYKVLRIV
jgi:cell division protein ZapE